MDEGRKRAVDLTAEVAAPIEKVWEALTEADQITRWFAPEAKTEPGLGGHIWMSWGEGMAGDGRITIWEPPHHLQVEPLAPDGSRKPEPIVVDYFLASESGAVTQLRVVNSGFAASADFDDEYDSTGNGWAAFLRMIQHGLGRHCGEPFRNHTFLRVVEVPRDEAWPRLLAGLGADPNSVQLRLGERYSISTSSGENLEGEVWNYIEPGYLSLTVSSGADSLLSIFCDKFQTSSLITICWILNGSMVDHESEVAEKWQRWFDDTFPAGA